MNTRLTPAALAALQRGDLANAAVAMTHGGIEAQERAGQAGFVGTSDSLPKDCPRVELERLGFVFGVDIDDLFVSVKFPDGWTKRATDHSMWSDVLDEKGVRRFAIFYKAAFYDRRAHVEIV